MGIFENLFDVYDSIIVLDVETTGLDPVRDRIIELAALRIRQQMDKDKYYYVEDVMDRLIKLPEGESLSENITNLTGIDDMLLENAGVTEVSAFMRFMQMIPAGRPSLLVAYNAQFDISFIQNALNRLTDGRSSALETCDYLDALTVYKDRSASSHKLADAVDHYNLGGSAKNSHRAIDDARAAFRVMQKMDDERQDLASYVNIFGVNPAYRVSGEAIGGVQYCLQPNRDRLAGSDMVAPDQTLPALNGFRRVMIYQIDMDTRDWSSFFFVSMDELKKRGLSASSENYKCVYSGWLNSESPEDIFTEFNISKPPGFRGHSLSVSDVIVTDGQSGRQAFYVDSYGFTPVPDFFDTEKYNSPEIFISQPESPFTGKTDVPGKKLSI